MMSAPFDLQSKLLMEDDPRVVLYALAGLPMDEPAEVEHVDREVTIGTKRIDHAYKVTRNGLTVMAPSLKITLHSLVSTGGKTNPISSSAIRNKSSPPK